MTSKQKVQEIAAYVKSNCYDVEMYLDCDKYEKDILKDLERLEMLEKQNKLLNETKDSVNKVLEDLGKINEENIKLKKQIEIIIKIFDASFICIKPPKEDKNSIYEKNS